MSLNGQIHRFDLKVAKYSASTKVGTRATIKGAVAPQELTLHLLRSVMVVLERASIQGMMTSRMR